jgi:hypothetical protein
MANTEQYEVALSYAGEDSIFADQLAIALKRRSVKVFFDKHEKSTLWGKNLYDYLSDLYQNKARYCVMFLSKHYAAKLWTTHERKAAQAHAFKEHEEYILPIRLDDTEIPGILPTIAYLRWPPEDAESIADATLEKLGRMPQKVKPSQLMSVDDIEANLQWFLERAEQGLWNEDDFWAFWDKEVSKKNLLRFLEAAARFVKTEDASTIFHLLYFMCLKYELHVRTCPRILLSLLSSDISDILHAQILQIIPALRTRVPKSLIINYLESSSGAKLYATCEYIENAGIQVDDDIATRLLGIIESDDIDRFYFVAGDQDQIETEIDARVQAAKCLMLADTEKIDRREVVRRVEARHPEIADHAGDIFLQEMVRGALYGLPRRSIPLNDFRDDEKVVDERPSIDTESTNND